MPRQQADPRDVRPPHHSESPQKRSGVFLLESYLASRKLLWAGDVARMPKSSFPKRLMFSWIRETRVDGGQEITYGRSFQRRLNHFSLPTVLTEWEHLAQDRAGWHTAQT